MSVIVADLTHPTGSRQVEAQLEFPQPPPGLLDLHRFELTALDDAGYLFALRSTERPDVRLFVVPPHPYFPAYAPRLDPSTRETLGVDASEAVLLVVVHPGQDGEPPTANLLAPVVMNPVTGAALQVVLDGDEWPLRAPFLAVDSAA
ncbi:MAG TPA: flagellar assembly protein FliW [Actinotalea sp.]|jgi:flagellar assembly factor FliW